MHLTAEQIDARLAKASTEDLQLERSQWAAILPRVDKIYRTAATGRIAAAARKPAEEIAWLIARIDRELSERKARNTNGGTTGSGNNAAPDTSTEDRP